MTTAISPSLEPDLMPHAGIGQIHVPVEHTNESKNGKSLFSDPAFASNKTLPVHRWVPWIAGFSSDFVTDVIDRFLPANGTVLDPFAGVGTTLVEAVLKGHTAIGFEINPYAALASRVKASAAETSVTTLEKEIHRFVTFYTKYIEFGSKPTSVAPTGFRTLAPFYSPMVLAKVLVFFDFLKTIEDERISDIFRLAFGATMVTFSNYSYEPSLARRVSSGKKEILDYPVEQAIFDKLDTILEDIEWMQNRINGAVVDSQVIPASFFDCKNYLPAGMADLIITSPPYLNNYHYNRNTRPQLYWLDFVHSPKDLVPIENANFGKFWQTVREEAHLGLGFDLPGSDLEERLASIRTLKPEKGVYGGNGWANYASSYFNDCRRFAEGIKHSLKPGGRAFVVIGNSILQGVSIPTDEYFAQIAKSTGLEIVGIDIPRATRVGNSIIQSDRRVSKAGDKETLYEAIVQVRNSIARP